MVKINKLVLTGQYLNGLSEDAKKAIQAINTAETNEELKAALVEFIQTFLETQKS